MKWFAFVVLLLICTLVVCTPICRANENKFAYSVKFLEDKNQSHQPTTLLGKSADGLFTRALTNKTSANAPSIYWLKIKYSNSSMQTYVLILSIIFKEIKYYQIDQNGQLQMSENGYSTNWLSKTIEHNAPAFYLYPSQEPQTLLVKITTRMPGTFDFSIVRNDEFYNNALSRFYYYGLFFGSLIVATLYCLVIYIGLRDRVYLYYALYVLSFLLFAAIDWGMLNKYLPFSLEISYDLFAIPYAFMTIFLLKYAQHFLQLNTKYRQLNTIVFSLIAIKIVTYPITKLTGISLFYNDSVDIALIMITAGIGVYVFSKGFKPAKYYLIGISLILIYLILFYFKNIGYINFITSSPYFTGYNFGLAEVLIFSISLADRYKMLQTENRIKNENVLLLKDQLINQLNLNEQHKEEINKKLEAKVLERTAELKEANELLELQKTEIQKLNESLTHDNVKLVDNVAKISKDRFDLKLITLDEFKQIYPDDEACYKFVENLKWKDGYHCAKCNYQHYSNDKVARKCSKCGYVESILVNTIFSRIKFPLHKAFYIIYVLHSGKIPSQESLSSTLELRRATISLFVRKVKSILVEKKINIKTKEGWTNFILLKDH